MTSDTSVPRLPDFPTDVAHVWHSETSRMSAEQLKPYAGRIGYAVWFALHQMGGGTCEQIEDYLKMKHQTVSGRIPRLVEAGLVVDSGVRATNRSGRKAVFWQAVNNPNPTVRRSRKSNYNDGRRDALLELKESILDRNAKLGGWWLGTDGKEIIAMIEQKVGERA